MTDVWLAEKNSKSASLVFGVFSTPEIAVQICQDDANGYFGAANTPPLRWLGNDSYRSASYIHPCGGSFLFQVTRFTVDQPEDSEL
jgi:hypothetical protein